MGNQGQISEFKYNPHTPIEGIAQGLAALKSVYGINTEQAEAALKSAQTRQANTQGDIGEINLKTAKSAADATSPQSQKAREEALGVAQSQRKQGYLNDQGFSHIQNAINGLQVDEDGNQTQGTPMSAADLTKDPETNQLMSLQKSKMAADATANRFNGIIDNKKYMQQNTIHEQVLGRIEKDPTIAKQIVQYQNLNNSLSLLANADHITPNQFDEAQQSIRSNLGIKGSSGVDERSHTYLNSLGLGADRISQMLTGKPASMDPNDPFIQHVKQLAGIEQNNATQQVNRRLNVLTAGHPEVYNDRPDLKAGLDAKIQAFGSLTQPTGPIAREDNPAGAGVPGATTAKAGGGMPSIDDIRAEVQRRAQMRQQAQPGQPQPMPTGGGVGQ